MKNLDENIDKNQLIQKLNQKINKREGETSVLDLPKGNADGFLHPDAIYFPNGYDNYKFWLFYTPFPPEDEELPYLCRSNDLNEFNTTGITNPLLTVGKAGSWDSNYLADPDVVYTNKKWFMYYIGTKFYDDEEIGHFGSIGLATSDNGIRWYKYLRNPIIEPSPTDISDKKPIELVKAVTPSVVHYKKKFYMVYGRKINRGPPMIHLAISKDGIKFEDYDEKPILGITESWEALGINHPKLFFLDDNFYFYYVGKNSDGEFKLGFAKAKTDDLTDWTKAAPNPVLSPRRSLKGKTFYSIINGLKHRNLPGSYTGKRIFSKVPHSWDLSHIYRSAPLVTAAGELAIVDTYCYFFVSAYDLKGPRIGIMKIEINN